MELLVKIERHLRATGVPRTRFGRDTVNDPRLVDDMRRGRVPGAEVRARIERALAGAREQ